MATAAPPQDLYPLSPLQQGLLVQSLQMAGSGVAFEQDLYVLRGPIDRARFTEAWQQAVRRHAILRTTFLWEGVDEPLQVVHADAPLALDCHDWRGRSSAQREADLDAYLRAERARGFTLAALPLMRLGLFQVADDEHLLVWGFHHAILDGWSLPTILRDVLRAYGAGVGSSANTSSGSRLEASASPAPRRYRDYIAWLKQQDLAAAERFWRARLAGVSSPTPLTVDRRAPLASIADDETYQRALREVDGPLSAALQAFARTHRLTIGTLLNAAWALLLARYAGVDDVVVGCTLSGRPASLAGVEEMVGLFINTLPLRVAVPPDEPVLAWLQDVQRRVLDLSEYQFSPLMTVQQWSDVPPGRSLFDSIIVVENYPGTDVDPREAGGLSVTYEPWRRHSKTGYPLTLLVTLDPSIRLQIWYDARRFEPARVTAMLGHLETVLASLIEDAARPIGDVALLTAPEREQIVVGWNATARDYPRDVCLHELIEAQARRTPDAPAVAFGSRQLTYRELDARAGQLARFLCARGVGPGTRVAVAVERSIDMVVGLLGILKAGAAYVPIDPGYPRDRLAFMLEDCAAPVLLTQARLLASLPPYAGLVIRLDEDWPMVASAAAEAREPAARAATATDPAYMIYTSGSTGRPKGALNAHRGIVNRLLWMQDEYGLTPADTVLQKTPFSFDVSVWEFFWPLIAGARLFIAEPGGHQSPDYLVRTIAEQQVTVLHFVPSMLRVFLEAPNVAACRSLRDVMCSGEALPPDLVRAFHAALPARLHNLYGPTEAAVDVTYWPCPRDPDLAVVPIGRPVANTQCYVLDRRLHPVPVGVPGELHLGGVQVGLGYHQRPELTAEKFIPDPFGQEPGGRLYKTGDLCRYLPDGAIEYLGRLDFQVKIRGFRIELGEIEAALSLHASIKDVIVVAREDAPGERRLVAYVVATEAVPVEALRAHLRPRLPEYMIPEQFVVLDRLPLSPNGKVDRRALPAPAAARASQTAFVPPATDLEKHIAAIWCEVLALPQVGTMDNFFEVGGQSLKLMRVHYRLRERLQRDVPIVALFQHPTIASLATFLSAGAETAAADRAQATARQDRAAQQREAARRLQQARAEKRTS